MRALSAGGDRPGKAGLVSRYPHVTHMEAPVTDLGVNAGRASY